MRSLTVKIEGELPDQELGGNPHEVYTDRLTGQVRRRTLHYLAKGRIEKRENERWYMLIVANLPNLPYAFTYHKARLTWEVWWPKGNPPDDDGLIKSLKIVRDTLQVGSKTSGERWRLGLIVDDSPRYLIETTLIYHPGEGPAATQFTLEEIE